MFIVETIAKIRRLHFVDGKGAKTIARELNISKNTVKKIIRSDATKFELAKYDKSKPVLDEYLEKLDKLLNDNLKEPVRRRLTAKKIFEILKADGYVGSYESINLVVRKFRLEHEARGKQVFIPLSFEAGQAFQFDWGLEEIELSGKIIRVKVARIKLCYSRYSLVVAYPNEQLEMVMAAHDEAFRFFNGTCKNGIFDNMTTAIKKILRGKERELNEKFAQMASHYLFEVIACTPASGWEKGQVEKQVGDTRRNFFTPLLKGNSFEEINNKLKEMCIDWAANHKHPEFKDKTIYEAYETEKPLLIPYRGEFTAYKLYPVVVSPMSLVNYDTNSYSVECAYVGLSVQIKAYAWEIIILHEGKIIGQHKRTFGRYEHIYNPWHYVPALIRKPGALRNGAPFKELLTTLPQSVQMVRSKLNAHKDADKEFIIILLYVTKYGLEKVSNACTEAIKVGSCSSEVIKNYLEPKIYNKTFENTIKLRSVPSIDCTKYNQIYLKGISHAVN
jgi:transposase